MPDFEAEKLAEEYAAFYGKSLKEILDKDYYRPDYFVFDQKFNELALPKKKLKGLWKKKLLLTADSWYIR